MVKWAKSYDGLQVSKFLVENKVYFLKLSRNFAYRGFSTMKARFLKTNIGNMALFCNTFLGLGGTGEHINI